MAGVEKITEEILQEAKESIGQLMSETKGKADEVVAAARKEAEKIMENSALEAARILEQQEERAKSSAQMRQRQAILSVKQEVIDGVISSAYEKLAGQDTAGYFSMIETLLKKNIHKGDGELCLSKQDMERLPKGFAEAAAKIAQQAGGSLKISEVPAKIANGFILKYGGVEENCSLESLFSQARDTLRDRVSSILW